MFGGHSFGTASYGGKRAITTIEVLRSIGTFIVYSVYGLLRVVKQTRKDTTMSARNNGKNYIIKLSDTP
jgi:hypothetical protein